MKVSLGELRPGQSGRIVAVKGDGASRRKLMDMGLARGAVVSMCGAAPFGDPVWVRTRGIFISLRRSRAQLVDVAVEDE